MAKAQAAARTQTKGARIATAGAILAVEVDVKVAVEIILTFPPTSPTTAHPEKATILVLHTYPVSV